MKVDSVITLDNDISCLLLEKVTYQDDNYFMAVVLTEDNEPSDEYIIFKEIIEGEDKYVEKIVDEELLSKLLELFTQSFNKMAAELPEL